MINGLMDFDEAVKAIGEGRRFIFSADESFLSKLPKGDWIGGTSPYSMSKKGGSYLTQQAYAQELPGFVVKVRTKFYGTGEINQVYVDGFESGFSLILMPALSNILVKFALEVPSFPQFAVKPLMGWVTGTKLEEFGKTPAKVFDGLTGQSSTDKAVLMHAELPADKYADLGVINIFDVPDSGDTLEFESDNLEVKDVMVNDKKMNFADYLLSIKADIRWPLVGDYNGAMVNSSFMEIDEKAKVVKLLAPVFQGIKYRLSSPQGDYNAYLESFRKKMPKVLINNAAITCNCIFNYKYGDLEGRPLDELNGPFVFGEIAYQILNQTMVYLTIHDR